MTSTAERHDWKWRTYPTESDAINALVAVGFVWNDKTKRHERGAMFVSLARAYVGKCKDGRYTISAA